MTSILPPEIKVEDKTDGREMTPEELELIERVQHRARARKFRVARDLAKRMQNTPDGSRVFIRFTRGQRVEHQVLIGSFTVLALTGLMQRYSRFDVVGFFISIFGGVEMVRTLHHLAALIFILQAIYHIYQILIMWFVKKERGGMWPRLGDITDLVQMLKFNLDIGKERPAFDRFSVEEKVEYWALLWGSLIMGVTGLVQWFPTLFTRFLPGDVIPISRTIHGWEAVLAVLSILIWHLYHTVIKEKNKSIFTGIMTEEEMVETHPLEYRRILAAHNYLQRIAAAKRQASTENVRGETQYEILQDEMVQAETTN